jgi:hypothetical protein
MTQIVENWARVTGRVEAWDPPAEAGGFGTLTLRVEHVSDIARPRGAPFRNLLKGDEGRCLRIHVPAAAVPRLTLSVGTRIHLDVRRGRSPDHVFARPESFDDASKAR